MRVKDVMLPSPCYCQRETNLGSATELMWTSNCGFLPVESIEGKVIGVITDRDICIALGTRNRPAGEIKVGEVMLEKLYSCGPDDDVHHALQTMGMQKCIDFQLWRKMAHLSAFFRWMIFCSEPNPVALQRNLNFLTMRS